MADEAEIRADERRRVYEVEAVEADRIATVLEKLRDPERAELYRGFADRCRSLAVKAQPEPL